MNIRIGIITAPAESAQSIADKMVKSGILAIWNFAPAHIEVPQTVLVKNENMAASLAVLSKHLSEQLMNT
jgi:redox-sensing transcriptional repressor